MGQATSTNMSQATKLPRSLKATTTTTMLALRSTRVGTVECTRLVWPVSSMSGEAFGKGGKKRGKKGRAVTVAGSPQVLTDSSDPRLLKHKPLPTEESISQIGAQYLAMVNSS